jgi:hypothetical protein
MTVLASCTIHASVGCDEPFSSRRSTEPYRDNKSRHAGMNPLANYAFSHCFLADSRLNKIFSTVRKPLPEVSLQGYNLTVVWRAIFSGMRKALLQNCTDAKRQCYKYNKVDDQ